MSENRTSRPVAANAGDIRSLPPQPSLEFEKKQARRLLRQLQAGDPQALARAQARHPSFPAGTPDRATLSEAQLIIAREYGFSSWPRFSRYLSTLERGISANRSLNLGDAQSYEREAQRLLMMHKHGWAWTARQLAAYVPRFVGQSIAEVRAAEVTLDDAKVVVVRMRHCTNWEQLLAHAAAMRPRVEQDPWERQETPRMRACRAIRAHDLPGLQALVRAHPELLQPEAELQRVGWSLMAEAIELEPTDGRVDARGIADWLAAQGLDVQASLNRALVRERRPWTVAAVRRLLDRGADPSWIAPTGLTVLEHAIVQYWNGQAVDLIAQRVRSRRAFWIAAGLGDVPGVRRFFGTDGTLTADAYRDRPPLELMSVALAVPTLPEPDDVEVMAEAALVAAMNGRVAVLELLLDMGYPVDHRFWLDQTLVYFAIHHGMDTIVEVLVRRGADLDVSVGGQMPTARQLAAQMLDSVPHGRSPRFRRIARLCGVVGQRPPEAPLVDEYPVTRALEAAGLDAQRMGSATVGSEHLMVGLICWGQEFMPMVLANGGVDVLRLRAHLGDRIRPDEDATAAATPPRSDEVTRTVERAHAIARERDHNAVSMSHLATALLEDDGGAAAQLLLAFGGSLERLRAEFAPVPEYGAQPD
ncbi:MAG: hypothetical protein IT355_07950 [Gemmatimonadaceae bacterium]|nr:hypothetical protein [Gemmatimonadaceae bacterium]